MSEKGNGNSDEEENVSKELARQFKWVEAAQIASNVILAIVGIIALCIYNGQLEQMRKSTKAAQDAAVAAQAAANTADATLKEIQKGGTDTHDLAVAAGKQATTAQRQTELFAQQLGIALKTAKAVKESSNTARNQLADFENSQRSILQMDVTWDDTTRKITWTLKNVGNSVAYNIRMGGIGGNVPVERVGIHQISLPQGFWERGIPQFHSDVGGFALEAHGIHPPVSEDVPPQGEFKSGEGYFYEIRGAGYKDTFGKEGYTYACVFYNPMRRQLENCYK
ncbi:MAG TPA: hypothetical protein VNZ03_07335 [Terriglobales bacterium]|jgi:hypothetical protein|nr:hypothetical protein [Terriglobales bacterium]